MGPVLSFFFVEKSAVKLNLYMLVWVFGWSKPGSSIIGWEYPQATETVMFPIMHASKRQRTKVHVVKAPLLIKSLQTLIVNVSKCFFLTYCLKTRV